MPDKNKIKLFEGQKIRSVWKEDEEEWYFSVVDVVGALLGNENPRRYWSDLKIKIKEEGSELYEKIVQLKLKANDGKMRLTDVANIEELFRIIQSIPSPKAEPFKLWLAKVGSERIDEDIDPELVIARAVESYRRKGYSEEWINQRMLSIKIRNGLTDEWKKRGVERGKQFAVLTDVISKEWSGMTTREYKDYKGLRKHNLRDNMTDTELILNMLAENTTKEISKAKKPKTFKESRDIAKEGGGVASIARKAIEDHTGKSAITNQNYLPDSDQKKRIEE